MFMFTAIRREDDALDDLARAAAHSHAQQPATKPLSAEHRARISSALKGRQINGATLSAEHKVRRRLS
jgi:hypothetical protein